MKKTTTRLAALALSLALLLTSCAGGTSATTMHLRKTEGSVYGSDGEGKDVTPKNNLGLYSGYQVGTQAESYAWIDLDKVKLTKLDQDSEVEINKEGKKLEINVKSGSLFFNVTEPLADDEIMNIATSTMMIGVRGTCGWVTGNTAALLEGTVSVTAGGQEATINAGEMAVLTEDGKLEVKPFTAASIPIFVQDEVAEDEELTKTVLDTTGINIAAYSTAPYKDALAELKERGEILYTEMVDFEGDGSPELLVLHTRKDMNDELLAYSVFRAEPEKVSDLFFSRLPRREVGTSLELSLVKYDGRLYLEEYDRRTDDREGWSYGGPLNDKNDSRNQWNADSRGWCNMIYSISRSKVVPIGPGYPDVRYDIFADVYNGQKTICTAEEFEEIHGKFSRVKLLAHSPDGETLVMDVS